MVELLVPHPFDPWRLGCHVPQQLLQLLWGPYCEHLIDAAIIRDQEGELDLKRLAAGDGAEHLAGLMSEALAAAPTAAHLVPLALKLMDNARPASKWGERTRVRPAAKAALAAAHTLDAAATEHTPVGRPGSDLLVAALAALPLLMDGTPAAVRSEALVLVRRCLQRPGSLVGLLLSNAADLRDVVLGTEVEAYLYAFTLLHTRPCRGGRRSRSKRIAFDPKHLR